MRLSTIMQPRPMLNNFWIKLKLKSIRILYHKKRTKILDKLLWLSTLCKKFMIYFVCTNTIIVLFIKTNKKYFKYLVRYAYRTRSFVRKCLWGVNPFIWAAQHTPERMSETQRTSLATILKYLLEYLQRKIPFSEIIERMRQNGMTCTPDDLLAWSETFVVQGSLQREYINNDLNYYYFSENSPYLKLLDDNPHFGKFIRPQPLTENIAEVSQQDPYEERIESQDHFQGPSSKPLFNYTSYPNNSLTGKDEGSYNKGSGRASSDRANYDSEEPLDNDGQEPIDNNVSYVKIGSVKQELGNDASSSTDIDVPDTTPFFSEPLYGFLGTLLTSLLTSALIEYLKSRFGVDTTDKEESSSENNSNQDDEGRNSTEQDEDKNSTEQDEDKNSTEQDDVKNEKTKEYEDPFN